MKVLLVNNLFGDNARGGAERVVEAEAQALDQAGHQVAILRAADEDGKDRWQGLTVFGLRQPNLYPYTELGQHGPASRLAWQVLNMFNAPTAAKAAAVIERFRPEVVHTHNLMGLGLMLPRRLARLGVRHVHTLHDVQLLHPTGLLPAGDKVRLSWPARSYAWMAARLFGSPEVVISPSEFLLKAHRRHGFFAASKTAVIANPAPRQPVDHPRPEALTFLFAGQLEDHKGVRSLLKAWDGWLGASESRLEIAGDGRLRGEVASAADRLAGVSYLGRLEAEELAAAYSRAAFTVLPSQVIENAPTAISEGYAFGCPAVAALTGGVPEMVEEGKTGFLFPPSDPYALRDAMNRALAAWKGHRWAEMSAAARRRVEAMTVGRHLKSLLDTYAAN